MKPAPPPPRPAKPHAESHTRRQPAAKMTSCGAAVLQAPAPVEPPCERRGQLRGHLRASRPGRVRGMPAPTLGDSFTSGPSQVHRSRQLQPIHLRARNQARPRRRRRRRCRRRRSRRRRRPPRPPIVSSAAAKVHIQGKENMTTPSATRTVFWTASIRAVAIAGAVL